MVDAVLQHMINLGILAGLTWTAAGSGRLLLSKSGVPFVSVGENAIFATAIGYGAFSGSVFLLGAFHLLYALSITILLGFFCILAVFGWSARPRTVAALPLHNHRIDTLDRIAGILLSIALFAGLLFVLTPADAGCGK